MLIVDRIQQLIMLVLVACSGCLLGIGQQNLSISLLAVSAAILSFVLNDWLQAVRLGRWVANVVALLVTAYALRGFFHSDSPQQLLMIANLLIYLQIVLLFQVKTPRVYWQILVLSLLQIVVAAAFNIRLEGGIVFFCYLLVSGIAMVILQVHSQTFQILMANRKTVNSMGLGHPSMAQNPAPLILAMHDQVCPNRRPLVAMIRQVFALGIVAIGFAAVTFYLIPRDEISWTGNQLIADPVPGSSRTMDLEENVQIYLSNDVVMSATFFDSSMNGRIELPEHPYFRGMPLSELFIKSNQTRWRAPKDAAIADNRNILARLFSRDFIVQSINLQPTPDPLLHTIFPAARLPSTPPEMEWRVQLTLLRRLDSDYDPNSSFNYDLAIPIGQNMEPLTSFSHVDLKAMQSRRLENQPDEFSRHSYLDRTRYPGLIQLAEQEAAKVSNRRDTIAVAQALTDYLLANGGYKYTLDFRNFDWDNKLDHIEDFVVNKRRGHCEFFASALVLMLRSQNIPARVVVGYHGGDFDKETESYVVRKRNAHAWVEAYIRPEDCPKDWFRNGQASLAGAWLRLDATPASTEAPATTTPLTAARDFWNTYVMGLNSAKQRDSSFQSFVRNPFRNFRQYFSLRYWQSQWQLFITKGQWHKSMISYVLIVVSLIGGIVATSKWLRSQRRIRSPKLGVARSTSFKKVLGRALSMVAPRLGRWMAGDESHSQEVAFFQRFLRILQRPGLRRLSFQTAREFGQNATQFFAQHQQATAIGSSIESVVDKFYWVRFSQRGLTSVEMQQVEASLAILEQNVTPVGSAT